MTLTGTTTVSEIELGSNVNKEVFYITKNWSLITDTV